jgi:outer membrane protein assembly factor BamB
MGYTVHSARKQILFRFKQFCDNHAGSRNKGVTMSSNEQSQNSADQGSAKPLRLWPGYFICGLMLALVYVAPLFVPDMKIISTVSGLLGSILFAAWWIFFSRAKMVERILFLPLLVAIMFVTRFFLDPSIATGNMGLMFVLNACPLLCIAFLICSVVTKKLSDPARRLSSLAVLIMFSGLWCFLRSDGIDGYGNAFFVWRWLPNAEQVFLAKSQESSFVTPNADTLKTGTDKWSGFRGENRDSVIYGKKISLDWKVTPPKELWRHSIGPGCSSFAVKDGLFYTQEQIGETETVSCYDLATGLPVWKHGDKARFWDSHAGAGPRSTPTLAGEFVYTLGATGILNKLEATSGSLIWTRNASADTGVQPPEWAFTASPLIVGEAVIIALDGVLAAYDAETGTPVWKGEDCGDSYSSPQFFTIGGVGQVIFLGKKAVLSIDPKNGKQNWIYAWPMETRILQPGQISDGDFLISGDGLTNLRRVAIASSQNQWNVKEAWTSKDMKLNFYDFVISKGYAYGFDSQRIACLDVQNGKVKWYGDRLGGFSLLFADQDLLVILTEKGELALVKASPDKYKLLSKVKVLKDRVWNHPAFANDILLIRNSSEMVAYRLGTM